MNIHGRLLSSTTVRPWATYPTGRACASGTPVRIDVHGSSSATSAVAAVPLTAYRVTSIFTTQWRIGWRVPAVAGQAS